MADEGLTLSTHPPLPKFYEGRKKRRHRNCVFRFGFRLRCLFSPLFSFFFFSRSFPFLQPPSRVSIGRIVSGNRAKFRRRAEKYIARVILRDPAANSRALYNGIVKNAEWGRRGFARDVIRRVIDPALDRLESSANTKRTNRRISSLHFGDMNLPSPD